MGPCNSKTELGRLPSTHEFLSIQAGLTHEEVDTPDAELSAGVRLVGREVAHLGDIDELELVARAV